MRRVLRPMALGLALLALGLSLLAFNTAIASSAFASSIPVHELGGPSGDLPASAASPLQVPGRLPVPRFRRGPLAVASSKPVNRSDVEGTRTNGKIVGVDGLGQYSCSGTALNTPSGSIVLTAGHCVINEGQIGDWLVFVPAFHRKERPFGTFVVSAAYVMPQWRRWENEDFDVAALRVRPNQFGRLTDVVGGLGYATGRSRFSTYEIFGYPAGFRRGEELRSCNGHGLGSDSLRNSFPGPPTVPAFCDMAGGSSGGGWVYRGKYVNGVTSYSYGLRSNRLYSPYFGPAIANFLKRLP
jgi:hypothetical protein